MIRQKLISSPERQAWLILLAESIFDDKTDGRNGKTSLLRR